VRAQRDPGSAGRVGNSGQVVGLDFEPANVALAREFAAERGLANVQVIHGDARRTGLPSASYDLVHARTPLINIPDPATVVAEMARLARPGGWVVAMEPDGGGSVCYPAHPAWDRLALIFLSALQVDGADTFIGRRLPELFRQAGLVATGVEAKADNYPAGHSRRTLLPDLVRSMRPKIVAAGLASERELDEVDHAVREHLNDPATLLCRICCSWPGAANRTARILPASAPREAATGDCHRRTTATVKVPGERKASHAGPWSLCEHSGQKPSFRRGPPGRGPSPVSGRRRLPGQWKNADAKADERQVLLFVVIMLQSRRRRSSVGGLGGRGAGGVAARMTSAACGPGPAGVVG
jgi:SAM-dependent methyltransferase